MKLGLFTPHLKQAYQFKKKKIQDENGDCDHGVRCTLPREVWQNETIADYFQCFFVEQEVHGTVNAFVLLIYFLH